MSHGGPGIVTPEAVVLAFETGGVGSRVLARIIDLAIQVVALLATVVAFAVLGSTAFGLAGVFIALFLILFGYPVAMETLWRGRTVGKAALGLRVVTIEGGQITFRHALIRGALGLVDLWGTGGFVGILSVLISPRDQRLGDMAAGTIVLRERTAGPAPTAVTFAVPLGWESYAATLDVSGLTASDYQAARAFLLRANSLDRSTRFRLAGDIATPLLTRLRHRPPPGVPAEAFLACVAARYQERQRLSMPARQDAPSVPAPVPHQSPRPPVGGSGAPPSGGFVAPD